MAGTRRRVRVIGYGPAEPLIGLLGLVYVGVLIADATANPRGGDFALIAIWLVVSSVLLSRTALLVGSWLVRSPLWGWPVVRLAAHNADWVRWRVRCIGDQPRVYCFLCWHSDPRGDEIVSAMLRRIADHQAVVAKEGA